MAPRRPAPATPALAALADAGVAHRVHRFAGGDRDFGATAAARLADRGIAAERIAKTLVIELAGAGPALAVLPVAARLAPKRAAAALGARTAALADPAAAGRATGYVPGGISPLGGRRRLPAVLDAALLAQPAILVSAGRRGLDVELDPAELVRLTGAAVAPITA